MGLKAFKQINSKTPDLNTVQSNISEIYSAIQRCSILDGTIQKGIFLTAGADNLVPTKLERPFSGFLIIDNNTGSIIHRANSVNDKFINLQTSVDTTVSIYIF